MSLKYQEPWESSPMNPELTTMLQIALMIMMAALVLNCEDLPARVLIKKSYGIELWTTAGQDTSFSLLGMPVEEDWVLHGPYSDKSLMRNVLTFELWSKTGRYGSRTRYVELIINNDYKGVYVLMEKVKRDKNRIDISKLTGDENSGDDLTGGYIIKIDKFDGTNSGEGWGSQFAPPNMSRENQVIYFQFDYPKNRNITEAQRSYIKAYTNEFEKALSGMDFRNPITGYQAFIDDDSFVDFAILNEINRNVDGYRLSTFLYKGKESSGGKLSIGPPWDFNLAFGNANYCDGSVTSGWAWDFNYVCNEDFWLIPFWWRRLMVDPEFVAKLQIRWADLRNGAFADAAIISFIDSVAQVLEEPQKRNFQRWNVLGQYIWPNNFVGNSYAAEIDYLKNWVTERTAWLDENFASLSLVTTISDPEEDITLIYPNPFQSVLNIIHPVPIQSLSIYNSVGENVMTIKGIGKRSMEIPFGELQSGIYAVLIHSNNGKTLSRKVVKF